MISVVLVTAGPDRVPPALLPSPGGTLLDDTVARLTRLGAPPRLALVPAGAVPEAVGGDIRVDGTDDLAATLRAVATVLDGAGTDVALVPGELMLHDEALADLLLDPRRRTAAAVSGGAPADVRRSSGQVVSAGSSTHRVSSPDAAFLGALLVSAGDVEAAAAATWAIADAAAAGGWCGDAAAYLLVALVRSGVPVAAVDVDPWPWARPRTAADAASATDTLSRAEPGRLRLARAVRPDDGFYSTFVVRKLSRRLTPWALRWRLRPNQITVASLVIGLLAAACFAGGGRGWLVAGALLLQLSLVVDCVDGEVARYTREFSSLGAWLDASTDRVKEYACYAGLAFGAAGGGVDVWLLAATMLTLQTTRHTTDYTFTLIKNVREGAVGAVPLDDPDDGARSPSELSGAERAVQASARSNQRPWVKWAKKAVYLPIGERWLVISVAAALGSARAVFVALLVLGLVALAYTTAGRVLRARTWSDVAATERERAVIRAQIDRGPLAAAVARLGPWQLPVGRFAWALPPSLRLVEYATIVVVVQAVAPDAMPAAFALLFALAYHHYDALYRVLNGLPAVGAVHAAGLGVEGRLIVVFVLAALGPETLADGLVVMAVALGALFVGVGTMGGLQAMRASGGRVRTEETVNA